MDLDEKAFIPKNYVTNSDERLKMYGFVEKKSKGGFFDEIEVCFKIGLV